VADAVFMISEVAEEIADCESPSVVWIALPDDDAVASGSAVIRVLTYEAWGSGWKLFVIGFPSGNAQGSGLRGDIHGY
jgi:hypothetical protein